MYIYIGGDISQVVPISSISPYLDLECGKKPKLGFSLDVYLEARVFAIHFKNHL